MPEKLYMYVVFFHATAN